MQTTALSDNSHLRVSHLKKAYQGRTVVRNTTLELHSGEVIGLLGPNGAGKTTSFYMIVGLVALDDGQITLNGTDVSRAPMHERARMGLAYLPQEASIFRKMSVTDNILAILETRPYTAEEREAKLESLLDQLHIQHIRNSQAVSLSGGERRRVEIARCLATDPKFILLDEPFAGIDPIAVIEIQKIIRYLSSQNIGILITDHNVRETLDICDRAYIVNEGAIFAAGTPDEIIQNEGVREVYLGKNFRL
ncbi:lipopolysaccharide export system ATP-binding protein [Methylophilus rhizosphaerae]|uniref:Lipopolysaccharide export system ATP-binding protein LptB n=1 Tax=Methylophilus rhizosphaerae TaxID=492660 RepID=A0A1G9CG08_9PROT|nr:LPS export ABC transporter ATP-binding protein [Methylophilus rhizosphaerae]SDK50587.1 lipopolysaccharide export system ATP-binding protein [Methylophilus rhizosphaerae]